MYVCIHTFYQICTHTQTHTCARTTSSVVWPYIPLVSDSVYVCTYIHAYPDLWLGQHRLGVYHAYSCIYRHTFTCTLKVLWGSTDSICMYACVQACMHAHTNLGLGQNRLNEGRQKTRKSEDPKTWSTEESVNSNAISFMHAYGKTQ
jgi:hypothetical protein